MGSQKSIFGLLSSLGRWQHLYHETQQLSEQLVHGHFNANPKNTISSNGISREIATTPHIQSQVQSVVSQELTNQNKTAKVVDYKSLCHRPLVNDNSEQSSLQLRR